MQTVQLITIQPEEFKEELVKAIKEILQSNLGQQTQNQQTEIISRQEAANLLDISLPTLYRWTKSGKLSAYGKGSRVYYKRHEIENSLVSFKR